jgi:phosphatidylglycerol---prolipoprotein diacylglyceryl transferase
MKPALLHFPHISSYPVLLLLGFFFAWLLARRRSAFFGIARNHIDNIALLLPLVGLFGARFFARVFYEKASFLGAFRVWEGDGLVFYGGFVFCVLAILLYVRLRHLDFVSVADCLAPALLLGLAFGRVGCFLAGCCWGDVCAQIAIKDPQVIQRIQTVPALSQPNFPFAVTFPTRSEPTRQHVKLELLPQEADRSLPVHPVQLYEAAAAGLLCWLLHRRSKGNATFRGSTTLATLFGYAIIRFGTEFLRADNKPYMGEFTFSQVVSIGIAIFCLAALAIRTMITPQGREAKVPYTPRPASG